MKRWMIFLMAVVLLFSGCSKNKEIPEDLPSENFDNSGEKTVVYRGDQDFTLSFTVDGEQQIENGTYWYFELENAYRDDWTEQFYTYDTKKQELNGSKDYTKLKNCFATNGNWPLFLNPVHTEYSASNQEQVEGSLVAMAKQQLSANQMEEAEAVITDVWSCDMDGDGVQETLFKACNYAEEGEGISYCILGFASGDSCQGLFTDFHPEGGSKPEKLTPMVCDLNGDGKWELLLYKKGDYESFTAFDFTGGNFTKCYEIIY